MHHVLHDLSGPLTVISGELSQIRMHLSMGQNAEALKSLDVLERQTAFFESGFSLRRNRPLF
ncbi:MAG: hypothetical protein HC902_06205 [Calothrix sp. SM1_5_4]|nr:hypothetical protein [Calothrix sp. SM1_5_4]